MRSPVGQLCTLPRAGCLRDTACARRSLGSRSGRAQTRVGLRQRRHHRAAPTQSARRLRLCAALSPPPPDTGRDSVGASSEESLQQLTPAPDTLTPPPPAYGQPASWWTLLLLSTCYLHASACSYALPALLPDVSADLGLNDGQAATLTSAALLTYSLLLIPAGAAADTVDRPRLLALGVTLWSAGTALSAVSPTFPVLLASRVLYAAGYATQNPVSMGIIPELFPRQRASAMAAYNTAIHLGRAVSFGAGALAAPPPPGHAMGDAIASGQLSSAAITTPNAQPAPGGLEPPPAGTVTVPLDRLEDMAVLGGMTILYITGDLLVLAPNMGSGDAGVSIGETARAGATAAIAAVGLSWRDVMLAIAAPGLLLAPLLVATVKDPGRSVDGASRATRRRMRVQQQQASSDTAQEARVPGELEESMSNLLESLGDVFASGPWRLITAAAVLTDFGAWALISFQSTYYERVFGLTAATYSPLLAVILPVAGIIGGVGGSLLVDRLTASGAVKQRRLLLVGASLLAAPAMTASLLAPDWITSLVALLPATALAEVWRAPATVIVRDAAPKGAPGAATAAYLAVRNALCGLGPVTAAWLTQATDLRHALLITPAAFAAAAGLFWAAESALVEERTRGLELTDKE